jgi:hypothetical protein
VRDYASLLEAQVGSKEWQELKRFFKMGMKLEDFATEMVAGNNFVKAAFAGFAGGGKSRTATEFVIGAYRDFGYTKPVLVIDNEKGSRFLIPKFREAGIKAMLKDTTNVADVLTAIDLLNAREIDFLFIDTLTKVWYRYVRDYLEKNRRVFMELQDWGKVLPKWQETFSDKFVAAQGSIVFTGRGGFEYEKEEDQRDEATGKVKKGQFVKSGVKMKMAGETPFEPDLNIWMEREQEIKPDGEIIVWREAQIMKDRSGLIDGLTFKNPRYEDLRPFIQYLVDVQTGVVAGESSSQNLAPAENYAGFDRRRQADIALDEIKEEMLRHHGHGMDAGTKSAKQETLEKITKRVLPDGTRSWARLESLRPEEIFLVRNELWKLTKGHGYDEKPPADDLDTDIPMDNKKEDAA